MKKIYLFIACAFLTMAGFAQPVLVKDIFSGDASSSPTGFCRFNGKVYFSADNLDTSSLQQRELWVSDGTTAGTYMVHDLPQAGGGAIDPYSLVVANGKLFFIGYAAGGQQVWITDGTSPGTKVQITASFDNVFSGTNNNLLKFGNDVYLKAIEDNMDNTAIFKTNGTVAGTKRLASTCAPLGAPIEGASLNGNLIMFAGIDNGTGCSDGLVKTNGTAAGTEHVLAFQSNISSNMVTFNNAVYFIGDSSFSDNLELWKTDGTTAGTLRVKEIGPGSAPLATHRQHMATNGTYLFFIADDGINGLELWRTDGTSTGTVMVKNMAPGSASSLMSAWFVPFRNKVYFTTASGMMFNLWASDGTDTGTVVVKDSLFTPFNALYRNYDTAFNELLFADGEQLFATDGTVAGTRLLATTSPANGPAFINEIICNDSMIIMSVYDTLSGNELYAMLYQGPPVTNGLSQESALKASAKVYPNPFKQTFIIENTGSDALKTFVLYNLAGKELTRLEDLSAIQRIDVSNHPAGLYFYSLTDAKGAVQHGKLVKE